MNAQAGHMKRTVDELVAMVGGGGKSVKKRPADADQTPHREFHEKPSRASVHPNTAISGRAKKEFTPDRTIPMDDEDFFERHLLPSIDLQYSIFFARHSVF